MKIDFFCPRWGLESVDWVEFARKIKGDNFDGVEVFPLDQERQNGKMVDVLNDNGLDYILLHDELKESGSTFKRYIDALERNLYLLVEYQNHQIKPKYIVSQTGREYFSMEEMQRCFEICDRIAQESGIQILQETHRNKWSYAAHIVKQYLIKFPSLRLALDLSHWICVSESFLEDQHDAVELAIKHTDHIHARVGHTQGPQVTDPRTEENKEALEHHLAWWDRWIAQLIQKGKYSTTITPEFGPYPYMAYIPNSRKPVAEQYEINVWMMQMLKNRYNTLKTTTNENF